VSSGKNNHPWRLANQPAKPLRASWPRNPSCVIRTPSAPASNSWNQELPMRKNPTQIAAKAARANAIRCQ
jgi:hypothetical protein